jgi:hypothetical protein
MMHRKIPGRTIGRAAGFCLCFAALAMLAFLIVACGGEGTSIASWERDPIVPGYSVAELNIGDLYSEVQAKHGDPEKNVKDGGYLYAYYGRTQEGGDLNDPASWRMVVTLYDNGDGYLDAQDEVGSVEVSSPYYGLTAGGVGLGSTARDVEGEFGQCENVSSAEGSGGEELQLYSYTSLGVDFLISRRDGVITVIITADGGLRLVVENSDAGGDLDGIFGEYQAAPIVPGQTLAGINMGDEFRTVKEKFGKPDSSGFTTEGFVYATYTGGYSSWKMNVYLEDKDGNDTLGDFDTVVSVSVRQPYAGKTPKGVGIASPSADVLTEFGPPERQSTSLHKGEEITIMEYNSKGIVFAVKAASGEVVEIDVNVPLAS